MIPYAFLENQYLGRDYVRTALRLVLIAFCFGAYVYERDRGHTENIYLIAGFGILGVSIILLFMLHYQIKIVNGVMQLNGLWTSRQVLINLADVEEIELREIKKALPNAVYNLHRSGTITFYASGRYGVEVKMRNGTTYFIGTQRPNELRLVVLDEIAKIKKGSTLK